ncbi:MAG: hypothetical protein ACON5B_16280 [Myxococcota bacterium]
MFQRYDEDAPQQVKDAFALTTKFMVGVTAWSFAVLPLLAGVEAMGSALPGDQRVLLALGVWVVGAAVASRYFPWKDHEEAVALTREYKRQRARTALSSSEAPALAAAPDDVLGKIAERVEGLAGDDAQLVGLVREVMERRLALLRDLASLEHAMQLDASVDGSQDERHLRLSEARDRKRAVLERLGDVIRDLHVELTLHEDDNHQGAVAKLEDLLHGLAAEAEVVATRSEGKDLDARRRAAARAAQTKQM